MAVEYLDNGNDDGTVLGQTSSEKIAFFGATPVVQQSLTATTLSDTSVSVSTTSAIWGFSTSTQANEIITGVKELMELIANLGLGA